MSDGIVAFINRYKYNIDILKYATIFYNAHISMHNF